MKKIRLSDKLKAPDTVKVSNFFPVLHKSWKRVYSVTLGIGMVLLVAELSHGLDAHQKTINVLNAQIRAPFLVEENQNQEKTFNPDGTLHKQNILGDYDITTFRTLIRYYIKEKVSVDARAMQIEKGDSIICIDAGCLKVKNRTKVAGKPGEYTVTLVDMLGLPYLAMETMSDLSSDPLGDSNLVFKEILSQDKKAIPFDLNSVRAKFKNTLPNMNSIDELAEYISNKQLKNSKNASNPIGGPIYIKAIKEAGLVLAKALTAGNLSLRQIEELNYLANQGINPYEDSANSSLAGVLRGTKNRLVLVDGSAKIVDLTNFQVFAGVGGANGGFFVPSNLVPKMITSLLEKINKVNATTPFEQIAHNYRTFIAIHPFADANGRTGRMILNFMLLKAGLPLPSRPILSIWNSNQEIFSNYLSVINAE